MSLRFWVEHCLFQVLGTRLCLVWQVLSRGTSFSDSWDLLFSWLGGEQGGESMECVFDAVVSLFV